MPVAQEQQPGLLHNLPRPSARLLARVVAGAIAFGAAGIADFSEGGSAAIAGSEAHVARIFPAKTLDLYTSLDPDTVISQVQQALEPSDATAAGAFNLSPSSLTLDGTIQTTDPNAQTTNQKELNSVGSELANAIPGYSVDFKQTGTSFSGQTGVSVTETFMCPSPNSALAETSFQSLEVLPNKVEDATFCPSDVRVTESKVNLKNPVFAKALSKLLADPLRSGKKWAANNYTTDMFTVCPSQLTNENPGLGFKYIPDENSVMAKFIRVGYGQYCDEVGRYTERVTAQIKKTGSMKFKQIGDTVLHIDGLWEEIGYYGIPFNEQVDHVRVPGIGNICAQGDYTNAEMRIQISEHFTPKHTQTFQQAPFSHNSNFMQSASATFRSGYQTICK